MVSMYHPKEGIIRVLVCSGIDAVASGLQRFSDIHQAGIHVVGRTSVLEDALERLDRFAPQVIVTDLDAGEGLHALQRTRAHTGARVLALTGSGDVELQDAAVRAGASGVLRKGEPVETLARAIRVVHEGELWIHRYAQDRMARVGVRDRRSFELDPAQQRRLATLTRKERRVAIEIARNASATVGQIAAILKISETTLRDHLASIYRKLDPSAGAPPNGMSGSDLPLSQHHGPGHQRPDAIVLEPDKSLAGTIRLQIRKRPRRGRD